MKHSTTQRIKSSALLVLILFQTFYPTAALAVGDSVSQPEFESYEEFNATDMVDLATGDFSYNIPLLNIPSPEGGFQVPLTYHAGIEVNEEASWVGLGWNLNPGVLTRNVSIFPDDYSGEVVNTYVNGTGGSGYVTTYPGYTQYYDSQKGKSGIGGIKGLIDIGTGKNSFVGIAPLGLTFKKGGQVSYDASYMVQGLITAATIAGDITDPMMAVMDISSRLIQGYGDMMAAHQPLGTTNSMIVVQNMEPKKGSLFGLWGKRTDYKWFIEGNKYELEYGTLHLDQMNAGRHNPNTEPTHPPSTDGIRMHNITNSDNPDLNGDGIPDNQALWYNFAAVSDMYYYFDSEAYGNSFRPTSLSYDNYNVKGPGISGSIQPFRNDMGMLTNSSIQDGITYGAIGFASNPVEFKYIGDYSNSYTYQNIGSNGPDMNGFPYLIDNVQFNGGYFDYNVTFQDPKVYINYNGGYQSLTEPDRADNSLINHRLVHGRHVEWFDNHSVANGSAQSKGFIDTHQSYNRSSFADNQIAGFSITNEAGMTYHYSLPVYNTNNFFCSRVKDPSTGSWITNRVVDQNMYAVAWLLTGITGPDFIDRGSNGIIDDNDWGYWVKFEYGKFSNNYTWRNPYYGNSGDPNTSYSMQKGQKETYYLNRISTRTHSAIFVKDRRLDGKGYYDSVDGEDSYSNSIGPQPSESLRLSDIYLLNNTDYNTLTASSTSGGYGLSPSVSSDAGIITNGDTYENVLDIMDLSGASGASAFLTQVQMQKIHFNYSYNLCPKTFNSFVTSSSSIPVYDAEHGHSSSTTLSGKLTLESVDVLTKNNARIMPNYSFKYGNVLDNSSTGDNPSYDTCRWDGNGLYKSGGENQNPASPHNCEKKADQWCLTDIVTPLSATIHAEYERDDYTSVNGYPLANAPSNFIITSASSNTFAVHGSHAGATTNLSDMIAPGCALFFFYTVSGVLNTLSSHVQSVSGNTVTMTNSLPANAAFLGNVTVSVLKKYGGGLRVKSITTTDETNSYKTKYIYTKDGTETGLSSGVASYENPSEKVANFDFYTYHQHPYTSIIYSGVTVVNGDISSVFNEKTKTYYHFVTPHYSQLYVHSDPASYTYGDPLPHQGILSGNFTTVNKTSAIGSLDTVKTYNRYGNVVHKTVFEFVDHVPNSANSGSMGCYTENTLLWENVFCDPTQGNNNPDKRMRFIQSYVINKPNILKSVITYSDRMVSKAEYTYDYMTGQQQSTTNTYGGSGSIEKYEDDVEYAYTRYPGMGSKALDPTNRNIMSAVAAKTSYVYDQFNQKQLLAASVQTWWSHNANYRDYSSYTGTYLTGPNTGNGNPASPYAFTFLPAQTYNWKSLVQENGAIKPTDYTGFNWSSSTQNSNWIKTSEVSLYDYYSHVLEAKDINGNSNSTKYGFNQSYVISGCPNAPYTGWCYSGAEDKTTLGNYYESEVEGSAYQYASALYAHTGSYCSKVNQNQVAFKFRTDASYTNAYKASVWVHQYNAQYAKLECLAYNSSDVQIGQAISLCTTGSGYTNSSAGATAEHIGSYYLLNVEVTPQQLPAGTAYLVFQVKPVNANVQQYIYADDFRVHPLNTPITANVFDPKTGKVMATLNGDNMATKYVYDITGKLINTYKETKLGFKMTSDIQYNYNR